MIQSTVVQAHLAQLTKHAGFVCRMRTANRRGCCKAAKMPSRQQKECAGKTIVVVLVGLRQIKRHVVGADACLK